MEDQDTPEAGAGKGKRSALALVWRVLRSALAIYVLVTLLVYLFQRKLQYFPDGSLVPVPAGARYRGIEEVVLTAQDGVRLCSWYWPGTRPVDILILHGNGGHRGDRLDWLYELRSLGCGFFIVDYRGYGGSGGSPSEEGFYRDAEAARAWLAARAKGKVLYFGESIGSGVAVELARRHPPAALIIQSGFSSAVDVARRAYPYFPVNLLMKDRFESAKKMPEVKCPVLCIHGDKDTIVPMRLGRALFDAASEPKEWFEVPGADHNDLPWIDTEAYKARIDAFIRKHLEASGPGESQGRR